MDDQTDPLAAVHDDGVAVAGASDRAPLRRMSRRAFVISDPLNPDTRTHRMCPARSVISTAPPVMGLLGHAQLATDLGDLLSSSQGHFGLPKLRNDLLRRVSPLSRLASLEPVEIPTFVPVPSERARPLVCPSLVSSSQVCACEAPGKPNAGAAPRRLIATRPIGPLTLMVYPPSRFRWRVEHNTDVNATSTLSRDYDVRQVLGYLG